MKSNTGFDPCTTNATTVGVCCQALERKGKILDLAALELSNNLSMDENAWAADEVTRVRVIPLQGSFTNHRPVCRFGRIYNSIPHDTLTYMACEWLFLT